MRPRPSCSSCPRTGFASTGRCRRCAAAHRGAVGGRRHAGGGPADAGRARQRVPDAADAAGCGGRRGVQQPAGGPRRRAGSEPTVMDGVEIHDPYRLFGLTSAFNPETISRFELATGGFSVKYGDRLSSLLVVENRDGDAARTAQRIGLAQHHRRQRRPRGRDAGQANGSWLVSGRRTYYDLVASTRRRPGVSPLRRRAGKGGVGARAGTARCRCSACAAGRMPRSTSTSDDARGEFNDDTNNDLASVRLDAAFGRTAQSHTIVAYSNSASTFGVNAAFENRSQRVQLAETRTLRRRERRLRSEARRCATCRCGRSSTGRSARTSSRPAASCIGSAPSCRSRSSAIAIPPRPMGRRSRAAPACPIRCSRCATSRAAACGCWIAGRRRRRWRSKRASGSIGAASTATRSCHRAITGAWSLDSRTRLRGAARPLHAEPRLREARAERLRARLDGRPGRPPAQRAGRPGVGRPRTRYRWRGASVRIEGYYKASSRLLIGRLETDGERQARLAQYDFPADARLERAGRSDHHVDADQRRQRPRLRLRPVRLAHDGAGECPCARLGELHLGTGEREAYGRIYPFEYDRRHAFSAVGSYRLTQSLGARVDDPPGVRFSADAAARRARRERGRRRRTATATATGEELVPARRCAPGA